MCILADQDCALLPDSTTRSLGIALDFRTAVKGMFPTARIIAVALPRGIRDASSEALLEGISFRRRVCVDVRGTM